MTDDTTDTGNNTLTLELTLTDHHSHERLSEAFLNDRPVAISADGTTVADGVLTDYDPTHATVSVMLREHIGLWVTGEPTTDHEYDGTGNWSRVSDDE